MKKRIKKAAALAAFGYLSVLGLGLGMLRAAQTTRRILYGGQPVMAQVNRVSEQAEYEMVLGGGEWRLQLSAPSGDAFRQFAAQLPPSMGKYILRLVILSDYAADYTAECISG